MSSSTSPAFPVSLLAWRPMQRNSLRGFAKIRLGKSLIISDVALHASHGKRWAQPPSKPQIDRDGNTKRDEKGKVAYVPVVELASREAYDLFSEAVIAAVEREHPGATDSTYAP